MTSGRALSLLLVPEARPQKEKGPFVKRSTLSFGRSEPALWDQPALWISRPCEISQRWPQEHPQLTSSRALLA